MNSDFERTSLIVNGYFYTFVYDATNKAPTYDTEPFIYSLGPWEKNINCFVGINMHHLPTDERIKFLLELERLFNILDSEERAIVDFEMIKRIMPSAKLALRVYNRKNISSCYRVQNKAVGKYIDYNGSIYMKKPSEIMNQYWRDYVKANAPEKPQQET